MKFTERKSLPIIGVINKSKVIKLSIISTVIIAIIAGTIVTIYILFGGTGFSEPEDCIGGYWGAIGENSCETREGACEGMEYFGIKLYKELNKKTRGTLTKISAPDSKVKVWVVPTNKELLIARDTLALISK